MYVYMRRDSICVQIHVTIFFRSEVAQSDFVPRVGQGATVFVSRNPRHIDALVQYRHEVKRSVAVQILDFVFAITNIHFDYFHCYTVQ